jgi:hypothetical protein
MGTRPPCRRSNARARDPRARDQPWPRPQLLAPKDQMIGVAHVERRLLIGQPELPLELLGHSEVVLVQERQPDAGRVPRAGVPGTAGPNVGAANALWVIARPRGPRPWGRFSGRPVPTIAHLNARRKGGRAGLGDVSSAGLKFRKRSRKVRSEPVRSIVYRLTPSMVAVVWARVAAGRSHPISLDTTFPDDGMAMNQGGWDGQEADEREACWGGGSGGGWCGGPAGAVERSAEDGAGPPAPPGRTVGCRVPRELRGPLRHAAAPTLPGRRAPARSTASSSASVISAASARSTRSTRLRGWRRQSIPAFP